MFTLFIGLIVGTGRSNVCAFVTVEAEIEKWFSLFEFECLPED